MISGSVAPKNRCTIGSARPTKIAVGKTEINVAIVMIWPHTSRISFSSPLPFAYATNTAPPVDIAENKATTINASEPTRLVAEIASRLDALTIAEDIIPMT